VSYSLALFPLQTVVFPGGMLPLRIFEPRYMEMVTQAIADRATFGICAIREGRDIDPAAKHYPLGTRVRVIDWDMPQLGIMHIQTQALERFVVRSTHSESNGLRIGEVDDVSAELPIAVPAECALTAEILYQIISELGVDKFALPHDYNNAVWVSYRLSEVLPLKLSVRQNLLEMNDSLARLAILMNFLRKQTN
jgi:Lon protease-like protein